MPKLKNRLLAILLALTTIITTTNLPPLTTTTYAADTPDNYMGTAISPTLESDSIDFAKVAAAQVEPTIQTLRISLIKCKTGAHDSDDPTGGKPVTKSDIDGLGITVPTMMNPIHLVPDNGTGDFTWSDKIDNVKAPTNTDPARRLKGLSVFNSRREYLANSVNGSSASGSPTSYVMSYNTVWESDSPSNPNVTTGHWVFNDKKFITKSLGNTVFPDRCVGDVLSGGQQAFYQDNPPTPEVASATTNSEYLDAIAKAVFVDEQYGQTEAKQVFLYHIVSKMLNKPSDPYCEEVETVVEQILSHKYDILIEPTITFKADTNGTIDAMFNLDPGQYITLTCGDLFCEDVLSTIFYGATSKDTSYQITSDDGTHKGGNRYRGFNPLTHNPTTASAMLALYQSLQLKDNYARDNLFAVNNTEYFVNNFHYKTGAYAGGDYWGHGADYNGEYSGAIGPLLTGATIGTGGAAYTEIYYQKLADLLPGSINPKAVKCAVDMASMYNTGGMYIVDPSFSSVNYTISAKGYGEPTYKTTSTGQKLPVYKEAFDAVTNQILVNVQTRLKMDSEITDPASPVKGTKWVDEVLVAEPTNYNTELPRSDGSGAYKVQPITSETAKAYIPAQTRSNVTLYYADESGNPLESYTQINGVPGNRNSSIITKDESTGQYYKLFLDNVNYYAYNPQTNEADTYQMSVSNNTSSERMADTNIATASNVFSDSKEGDTNWININIPSIEKRPTNAAYILVKSTVNMGATLKHKTTDSLSEQVAQSRPQQHLDSAGNLVNEYALAYPESSNNSADAKAVGEVETIQQQADNQIQFLIPIQKEYDLSADSIQIIQNTSTSLLNLQINTESSATDSTAEDYQGETTRETLYLFATTDLTKAQQIDNYFKNKANTASTRNDILIPVTEFGSGTAFHSEFLSYYKSNNLIADEDVENPLNLRMNIPNASKPELSNIITNINSIFAGGSDTVYLVAGLVINHDIENLSSATPTMESSWGNNIVSTIQEINIYPIPPSIPPGMSNVLTCYPTFNTSSKVLAEYNNYRNKDLSTSSPEKFGLTDYSLGTSTSTAGPNLVYGTQVKAAASIPNSSPLGRRSVLEYVKNDEIIVNHCGTHSNVVDQEFPKDLGSYSEGSSSSGVLDVCTDTKSMKMHNHIFKYLEFDESKNKFIIRNQLVNDGFFKTRRTYCTHYSVSGPYKKTRHKYVVQYKLKSEQPDVYYTILYDHNYAQSMKNSMVYSIDSILANTKDKGKYMYLIEAGSRFGVNLQERIITDMPVGDSDIQMGADCYYPYKYNSSSSAFRMNNDSTKKCLVTNDAGGAERTIGGPLKIVRNIYEDYNGKNGASGVSKWDKSNESYNMILAEPHSLDAPWYDYYPSINKYQANDATKSLYSNYAMGTYRSSDFKLTSYFSNPSELKKLSIAGVGDAYRINLPSSSSVLSTKSWVCSTPNKFSSDYINVRYFRFVAPNNGNARGFYTNPDYPDSIKVNPKGDPTIKNQEAVKKFFNTPATNFEKAMGYQGLRINLISYLSTIKVHGNNVYLDGLEYKNLSDPGATGIPGVTNKVVGDCTTFSLVVVGSTNNRYNTHQVE